MQAGTSCALHYICCGRQNTPTSLLHSAGRPGCILLLQCLQYGMVLLPMQRVRILQAGTFEADQQKNAASPAGLLLLQDHVVHLPLQGVPVKQLKL